MTSHDALVRELRACAAGGIVMDTIITRAADAIESLSRPLPSVEWQTMDTAPKDGTNVLLFAARTKSGARRHNRRGCMYAVAHYETGWGWLSTPGDYSLQPTLWMPIPGAQAVLSLLSGAK